VGQSIDRPAGAGEGVHEVPASKAKQTDLVYAALAAIAIVFIQDYVAIAELNVAATVSLFAFAIALPLLGALSILSVIQTGYRFTMFPWWMTLTVSVALGASLVGIVAAFWSASAAAGLVVLVMAVLATVLVIAYRTTLDRANRRR
jgi:hypothetical protein